MDALGRKIRRGAGWSRRRWHPRNLPPPVLRGDLAPFAAQKPAPRRPPGRTCGRAGPRGV